MILSGSFGTISGQPTWLATIFDYMPVRPIIDATTRTLQGGDGMSSSSLHGVAVLVAWAAVGMVLSMRHFRWTPRTVGLRRENPGA